MHARTGPIVLLTLILGLAGGAATTYLWLTRPEVEHTQSADPCCGEQTVSVTAKSCARGAQQGGAHGEGDERESGCVKLSEEAMRQFGVELAPAAGGQLERTLKAPAEIVLNADKVAHIVPRVGGMAREVLKSVGDEVRAGDLLAVLDSRELAEAKAADLAAEARLKLAENNFKRVEDLLAKKIAPEQEYFEALQNLEEARIQHRETEAKLHALGLPHDQLAALADEKAADFSRYEIRAPFPGTIVDKHITLGELHGSGSDVFVIADLSTVWADVTLYPQDAAGVRVGQKVHITAVGPDGRPLTVDTRLFYVSPIISERTRTGLARALVDNESGLWKPGTFVTAEIVLSQDRVAVLVPHEAIQTVGSQAVVFVSDGCGFEKRPVTVGKNNSIATEVLSGLKPGEQYVAKGAFLLKAELAKGEGGGCGAH